jgi:hypothetical protein
MPIPSEGAGSTGSPARSPVPYHQALFREFNKVRDEQAARQGRQLTDVNSQAGRVVFETGVNAVQDVHQYVSSGQFPRYVMRVASLATGSGKSTSAIALVAAYCRVYDGKLLPRDNFSAAFVVPTVTLAKETLAELQPLMPAGEKVAFWTSEEQNVSASDLGSHRVVIFCHAKWQLVMQKGPSHVDGFRHYDGQRRKLIFVDEKPDLVKHMHVEPSAMETFLETVARNCPGHFTQDILSRVVSRMNGLLGTTGQRFEVAEDMLSPGDGLMLTTITKEDFQAFVGAECVGEKRKLRVAEMEDRRDFLVAASVGGCFY